MKRAFLAAAVALLGFATVWSVAADDASATRSDKVRICHATASATNPFTSPDVNTSSIDEEHNQYLNGHGDHENDIIPPFESPTGTVFHGLNWDAEGQAIWNNGCVVPPPVEPPTPEEVPVLEPTLTAPTCTAPGEIVIPDRDGLEYVESEDQDQVTVIVSAADGYVLEAGATTSWTFPIERLAQLDPDDPLCRTPEEPATPPETPNAVVPPQVEAQGPEPAVVVEAPATAVPTATASPTATAPPTATASPTVVAPTVAAAPTELPITGSSNWLIFLVGLGSMLTGAGFVALSRRTA